MTLAKCIFKKSFQLLKTMWVAAVEQSSQLHGIQVLQARIPVIQDVKTF